MTKEQQRIAIAEWMGYKEYHEKGGTLGEWEGYDPNGTFVLLEDVPNYPEDLNAIHGAEKKLTDGHRVIYVNKISLIIGDQMLSEYDFKFSPIHATASQRSEALCRTLWPERFQ